MTPLEDALISSGLTPTEAKIYLAGLARPQCTLQELCTKTRIKRPTLYHTLHTLIEKGMASEQKEINKSYFTMSDPSTIRALVERQRDAVDDRMKSLTSLIPLLQRQQGKGGSDGPTVVQHHGMAGMKTVMDIALYCKSKKWDIIAPYHNFLREYDAEYARKYLRSRALHRIVSRTLWEPQKGWKKLSPEEVKLRNPRFMPEAMKGKFQSMIILFDDKIAMFSPYKDESAILITSRELNAMFSSMFEAIWEVSKEYA
jgi:DNA-binding MarR family transcriptional regulator